MNRVVVNKLKMRVDSEMRIVYEVAVVSDSGLIAHAIAKDERERDLFVLEYQRFCQQNILSEARTQ